MFCPYCGETIPEGSGWCPACGEQIARREPSQPMELTDAIEQAIKEVGPSILRAPGRIVGYVMDKVPESDRAGTAFINNCDDEFIAPFEQAARVGTADEIENAAARAEHLLADDRYIVPSMARTVARSMAQALARYMRVSVSFDDDEVTPLVSEKDSSSTQTVATDNTDRRGTPDSKPTSQTSSGSQRSNSVPPSRPTPQHSPVTRPTPQPGPVTRPIQQPTPQPNPAPQKSILPAVVAILAVGVIIAGAIVLVPRLGTTNTSAVSTFEESTSSTSSTGMTEESKAATDPMPADTPAPEFTKATASSTLPPEEDGHGYEPEQVLDDDRQTCWSEGQGDSASESWRNSSGSEYDTFVGKGEWVQISADDTQYVSGIKIQNGYPKVKDLSKGENSETYYYYNTRPRNITIELSDGWKSSVELQDADPGDWQSIAFGETHATTYVKITIDSVYDTKEDGSTRVDWPDTSIVEIKAY